MRTSSLGFEKEILNIGSSCPSDKAEGKSLTEAYPKGILIILGKESNEYIDIILTIGMCCYERDYEGKY